MASHLIIDGNNLLFRCYWSAYKRWHETKPSMYGSYMINVIASYIKLFNPSEVIVTWDERKGCVINERKEISEEYKANREYNPDVFQYVNEIREMLDSLGVRQMYPLNREGDDIMYWLCAYKYPNDCILVSTDTDMYQLVRDDLEGNIIYNPAKKIQVNPMYLKLNYGVNNGREFILKKALRGDKSDNIMGIRLIRSAKIHNIISIINSSNDMAILKSSGMLSDEEYDIFTRNLELMNLDVITKHPEEIAFYEQQLQEPVHTNKERFMEILKEMRYWNMLKKCNQWFSRYQCKPPVNPFEQYYPLF